MISFSLALCCSIYFQQFTSVLILGSPLSLRYSGARWTFHIASFFQSHRTCLNRFHIQRKMESDYADDCLTSIQMGVFQQVLRFTVFLRFSLLGSKGRKKTYQPLPGEIWIVYVMKDILYHLQYNFSWSRRYDAYALVKRDELVRCAFLMVHLLLSEWEG